MQQHRGHGRQYGARVHVTFRSLGSTLDPLDLRLDIRVDWPLLHVPASHHALPRHNRGSVNLDVPSSFHNNRTVNRPRSASCSISCHALRPRRSSADAVSTYSRAMVHRFEAQNSRTRNICASGFWLASSFETLGYTATLICAP